MSCPWCGSSDHPAFRHGGLGRRARWFEEEYPFREPRDMPGVTVTLTEDEIARARERAERILKEDNDRGWRMYFTPPGGESELDVKVRGTAGELAAAKVTGLKLDWRYLPGNYRRRNKRPDMGRRVEIRTARATAGRLWASTTDPATRVFLLVTGNIPTFTVCGWLEGQDLLVPDRWLEPPDVRYAGYFADRYDLNELPLPPDA